MIDVQSSEQEWMKQYGELLEAKTATLRALPAEKRMALRQRWIDLHEEIKSSLDEDPAGTTAQAYADRWLDLLKQVSGVLDPSLVSMFASHEGQADAERFAKNLSEADRARARAAWQPVTDRRVWDFIHRAIALRTNNVF